MIVFRLLFEVIIQLYLTVLFRKILFPSRADESGNLLRVIVPSESCIAQSGKATAAPATNLCQLFLLPPDLAPLALNGHLLLMITFLSLINILHLPVLTCAAVKSLQKSEDGNLAELRSEDTTAQSFFPESHPPAARPQTLSESRRRRYTFK